MQLIVVKYTWVRRKPWNDGCANLWDVDVKSRTVKTVIIDKHIQIHDNWVGNGTCDSYCGIGIKDLCGSKITEFVIENNFVALQPVLIYFLTHAKEN